MSSKVASKDFAPTNFPPKATSKHLKQKKLSGIYELKILILSGPQNNCAEKGGDGGGVESGVRVSPVESAGAMSGDEEC
jgi:hypothetical protein